MDTLLNITILQPEISSSVFSCSRSSGSGSSLQAILLKLCTLWTFTVSMIESTASPHREMLYGNWRAASLWKASEYTGSWTEADVTAIHLAWKSAAYNISGFGVFRHVQRFTLQRNNRYQLSISKIPCPAFWKPAAGWATAEKHDAEVYTHCNLAYLCC